MYDRPVRTADFDYDLPAGLIAQQARPRGTSRLLVFDRASGETSVRRFSALPALLRPTDLLVLNDVRVIPARLRARRPGGGGVELLLVRPAGGGAWEAMARPSKRLRPGVALTLADGTATPVERVDEGRWIIAFDPPLDAEMLSTVGEVPLPPYISGGRAPTWPTASATRPCTPRPAGAVAAPTAGLHFTPELLAAVEDRGVRDRAGHAARRPGDVQAGPDRESPRPPPRRRGATSSRRLPPPPSAGHCRSGRRIVCVGTTSCRAVEHALAVGGGRPRPGPNRADLFILPGIRLRAVGALLTNFHLPRSTLLMLVSALAGRERVLAAYRHAVAAGFRFYSYGDAMLVG